MASATCSTDCKIITSSAATGTIVATKGSDYQILRDVIEARWHPMHGRHRSRDPRIPRKLIGG
jgi:hypothetical protein